MGADMWIDNWMESVVCLRRTYIDRVLQKRVIKNRKGAACDQISEGT